MSQSLPAPDLGAYIDDSEFPMPASIVVKSPLRQRLEEIIKRDSDDPVKFHEGFDDCLVGMIYHTYSDFFMVYDRAKFISKLMNRNGWSEEEAEEWFGYNIERAQDGVTDPVFLITE